MLSLNFVKIACLQTMAVSIQHRRAERSTEDHVPDEKPNSHTKKAQSYQPGFPVVIIRENFGECGK